jgi:hypothetical protein
MPLLLAGIVAIVALPWLFRNWLKPGECLLLSALIAISPLMVNYSRIARPYSLLFLLAGASIVLAWLWWQNRDRTSGILWAFCAIFAAWLNPVSLAVTTAPFLWFIGSKLAHRAPPGARPIGHSLVMGVAIALGTGLLLYAPFSNDFASLAVKSGLHQVNAGTIVVAFSLFTGSGFMLVSALMVGAAAAGWISLKRRDRHFAWYLAVIAVSSTLAVVMTGAEWISEGIVLARYLIGLLPVFLALASIGLVMIFGRRADVLIPVVLLALFLAGPLPQSNAGHNQFTHHMAAQFDYKQSRNPISAALAGIEAEPFYREIAELHPAGDAVVVEGPWYLESNWNALPLYQAEHRQVLKVGFIGGSCAGSLYGELQSGIPGLEFRNFVFLEEVVEGKAEADYFVLRTGFPQGYRDFEAELETCGQLLRDAFGPPWRSMPSALVFRLP